MSTIQYRDVENLKVYNLLCDLHIRIWELTKSWPRAERFELTSQVLRSSNSSPAQLAEKNADRHIKNRMEGVNRSRGEAEETVHHLRISKRKSYITEEDFQSLKSSYQECICMLNGLEKNLESTLPVSERKYVHESDPEYHVDIPSGYPVTEDLPLPSNL